MKTCKFKLTVFLLVLHCLFVFCSPLLAQKSGIASPTAASLFDMMEKRTEKINSIKVEVLLQNSLHSKNCSLSIVNPDKFSIEFDDGSIQTFFNGKKLWLKIAELKEVFYHFSASEGSIWSYMPLFSPKKIFTNLTRNTLFSLFNIELKGVRKVGENTIYTLKFSPKMRTVFKEVFSVGHYLMDFSDDTYLPTQVVEFDASGEERGRLIVKKYHINSVIPPENFDFTPPPGYSLVPFSVVFAQKLEECGKFLVKKIGEAAKNMKRTILDWGF